MKLKQSLYKYIKPIMILFIIYLIFIIFIPSYDNFDKYEESYYNIANYALNNNINEISYNKNNYCINFDCEILYNNKDIILDDLEDIGVNYLKVYNNEKLISIPLNKSVLINLRINTRWYARDISYFYKEWFFIEDTWVKILNNSKWHISVLKKINNDWALIKID